jgi:hypothetical protein
MRPRLTSIINYNTTTPHCTQSCPYIASLTPPYLPCVCCVTDIVGDCYIVVAGLLKEDQDGFVCVDEMDESQVSGVTHTFVSKE